MSSNHTKKKKDKLFAELSAINYKYRLRNIFMAKLQSRNIPLHLASSLHNLSDRMRHCSSFCFFTIYTGYGLNIYTIGPLLINITSQNPSSSETVNIQKNPDFFSTFLSIAHNINESAGFKLNFDHSYHAWHKVSCFC